MTYAPTVGSLMYKMIATQSDIAHVVGVVSKIMHNPGRPHWNAVKHVALLKNSVHHNASKHIDVRYHFVRDCVI